MQDFALIVAVDQEYGIGLNGDLPWHIPGDLKYFSQITSQTEDPNKQNAVIMGRVTWESIPSNHRPLKDRKNIILTRDSEYQNPENTELSNTLEEAINKAASNPEIESIFVIGGGRVFHEAILKPECKKIYLTEIQKDFTCDTFFPKIYDNEFKLISDSETQAEKDIKYSFKVYERI